MYKARARTLLIAGAASVAVTGGLVAASGSLSAPAVGGETTGPIPADRDLGRDLAVFRTPPRRGDRIPNTSPPRDEAVTRSRQIARPIGRSSYFVVPFTGGVCVYEHRPSDDNGTCAPVRDFTSLQLWSQDEDTVFGLAKDGVAAVRMTFDDGTTLVAPVRRNGFAARVGHRYAVKLVTAHRR